MPRPIPTRTRGGDLFSRVRRSIEHTATDGVPQVADLPCDLIEQHGKPYMRRHFLLGGNNLTPGTTARYHNILESDLSDLHDHPWDFVSVILSGSYVETTPTDEREFGPGSVLVRTAEQLHRLSLPKGDVWTFVIVGPVKRRWGFQTEAGWQPWRTYLGLPDQSRRSSVSVTSRTW